MSIYTLTDAIVIGKGVGANALAALSITTPLLCVLMAMGILSGQIRIQTGQWRGKMGQDPADQKDVIYDHHCYGSPFFHEWDFIFKWNLPGFYESGRGNEAYCADRIENIFYSVSFNGN